MVAAPNSPLGLAASQIGLNERDQNVALQEYLANGGVNLDPAVTAWCAAFVNATLAQSGQQGTGSNMARSFLEWGQAVDPGQVAPGDVMVLPRGDPNGPYGHVGIVEVVNPDGTVTLIGGNQGDAVSRQSYSIADALGFRRGGATPAPSGMEADGPGCVDRNPARLAWAYANGKMSPEDAALYEKGMADGAFPRAERTKQPDPLEIYAATAMRPRQAFAPVPLGGGQIQNATPFGRV